MPAAVDASCLAVLLDAPLAAGESRVTACFFSPQLALCHRRVRTTAAPQIDARLTGRTRCRVPERAGPLLTAALLMQRCRALSIRSIIGSPDGFAQDGGGGGGVERGALAARQTEQGKN